MSLKQLVRNADQCAYLAEEAKDVQSRRRYQRMYDSWIALIESQAWLEGKVTPTVSAADPLELLLKSRE
jgi:hypothetical protein